ncbi:MAG: acetyl/propionyl-CoA carboxylase subunit alpha, partial [Caulobacterales bacterium]|nr:acetyl/propionyl-CoA carboxylase subunit alpha [Caulobacterales bacterium]
KFITEPRHIEIQVLADKFGNTVYLGERECSIQRRNQKVIEEAPSPFLDAETREAMGAQAIALAKAVDSDSAGTVEFIVDGEKNFYFLEMNTRIQVAHPVTELITGVDIVEQMLRAAAGEALSVDQSAAAAQGWSIEARVYAEDPFRGFVPSIGRLSRYRPPAEGPRDAGLVRIDTGVREGDTVTPFYDPMIAKVVSHAGDRETARHVLIDALDRFEIRGVEHNVPFVSAVLAQDRFASGNLTTAYIGEEFPDGFHGVAPDPTERVWLIAAAVYAHAIDAMRAGNGQSRARAGDSADARMWAAELDGHVRAVRLTPTEAGARLAFDEGGEHYLETDWRPGSPLFEGQLDGAAFALMIARDGEGFALRHRGARARVIVATPRAAELRARLPEKEASEAGAFVESPMPGQIASVVAAPGQTVKVGQPLLIVEAMKMENIVRAERDGVIKAIPVAAGDSVAAGDVLAEFE